MDPSMREAVERFQRRTRGIADATLRRNLEANVYGPPGSRRRTVAESALRARFAESAGTLRVADADRVAELASRADRAHRAATTARLVAIAALLVASVALVRALGWL